MLKKRGAIYSVIALMLCAAVYLNWSYNQNNPTDESSDENIPVNGLIEDDSLTMVSKMEDSQSDYFAEARLSRQKARDEAVNILNTTIENENSDSDAVLAASAAIETMANNAMVESRIETLVIAKGFKECVTYVSDGKVDVIISKTDSGLKDADVAKIKDIVIDEAGVTADKIKIIESDE